MTAAVAIIVSMVMVSVPAEEENKNIDENDCGCGCNEAPTEGTPLNYDEKIKEMENLKIEFENLNKILNSKKEQFYTLCKNNDVEKAKAAWKEIKDLTREYWDKKERYIELKIMMEYVGKGRNNEMVILKNTLPKIEDIDFKISAKMNAWELIGEQIVMQKYPKMNKAIETGDTDKIKETFNEIDFLEKDFWNHKEQWIRLEIIKSFSENESEVVLYSRGLCANKLTPPPAGTYYLYYWRPIRIWVGMYDETSPFDPDADMIGEYCSTYFTTNMNYYWGRAKDLNSDTKSIQVKWFYLARATYDGRDHDIIWEKNKNATTSWPTPGYADYTTTHKNNGNYGIGDPYLHHACCYNGSGWYWCNTHCGYCFACDADACQHFATENP